MVEVVVVAMVMVVLLSNDRLGHRPWSIIHCLHVFDLIRSWQVGCKQVVVVVMVVVVKMVVVGLVVVVLVVVMVVAAGVVKVMLMSD